MWLLLSSGPILCILVHTRLLSSCDLGAATSGHDTQPHVQGHVVEVLLNGVRVHAASTAATLTKRPAELSFELGSEHMLPELTGSSVYLHVRPALPAARAASTTATRREYLREKTPHSMPPPWHPGMVTGVLVPFEWLGETARRCS